MQNFDVSTMMEICEKEEETTKNIKDGENWMEQEVVFKSQTIHMRPMQRVVRVALLFRAEVEFMIGNETWNAKSILDLIILAAKLRSSNINACLLRTRGDDAHSALTEISKLIKIENANTFD